MASVRCGVVLLWKQIIVTFSVFLLFCLIRAVDCSFIRIEWDDIRRQYFLVRPDFDGARATMAGFETPVQLSNLPGIQSRFDSYFLTPYGQANFAKQVIITDNSTDIKSSNRSQSNINYHRNSLNFASQLGVSLGKVHGQSDDPCASCHLRYVGNGKCDTYGVQPELARCNCADWDWDGGDCCHSTCKTTDGKPCSLNDRYYDCRDPLVIGSSSNLHDSPHLDADHDVKYINLTSAHAKTTSIKIRAASNGIGECHSPTYALAGTLAPLPQNQIEPCESDETNWHPRPLPFEWGHDSLVEDAYACTKAGLRLRLLRSRVFHPAFDEILPTAEVCDAESCNFQHAGNRRRQRYFWIDSIIPTFVSNFVMDFPVDKKTHQSLTSIGDRFVPGSSVHLLNEIYDTEGHSKRSNYFYWTVEIESLSPNLDQSHVFIGISTPTTVDRLSTYQEWLVRATGVPPFDNHGLLNAGWWATGHFTETVSLRNKVDTSGTNKPNFAPTGSRRPKKGKKKAPPSQTNSANDINQEDNSKGNSSLSKDDLLLGKEIPNAGSSVPDETIIAGVVQHPVFPTNEIRLSGSPAGKVGSAGVNFRWGTKGLQPPHKVAGNVASKGKKSENKNILRFGVLMQLTEKSAQFQVINYATAEVLRMTTDISAPSQLSQHITPYSGTNIKNHAQALHEIDKNSSQTNVKTYTSKKSGLDGVNTAPYDETNAKTPKLHNSKTVNQPDTNIRHDHTRRTVRRKLRHRASFPTTANDIGCSGQRLLLDGGLATHLETLGSDLSGDLWSARILHTAPEQIQKAHEAYLRAGCDIITTASYQCSVPLLTKTLSVDILEAEKLIRRSVELAFAAVTAITRQTNDIDTVSSKLDTLVSPPFESPNEVNKTAKHEAKSRPLVAASIGPYGACLADGSEYTGHYKNMPAKELIDWHRRRFELVCDAGADILACETLPCRNEVVALCALLSERPTARAWISFACNSGSTLNSGESLADAIADIERLDTHGQVEAIGINCTAPRFVSDLICCLRANTSRPLIIYPNSGERWDSDSGKWVDAPVEIGFGSLLYTWAQDAQILGGCCRLGPNVISDMRGAIDAMAPFACSKGKPAKTINISRDVVLDVDTGIDDALAILLSSRCSEINLMGVMTTAGNTNVDTVTENSLKVLDSADAPFDLPIAKGATHPLHEPTRFCPEIHGKDGLGDLDPPLPSSKRRIDSRSAVDFLLDTLTAALRPITIIALAPLTNIAMAIQQNRALCEAKIACVFWMGGSAFAGGNFSAWAEANAAYDPEAADIVFKCKIPVIMYPWDVYLSVDYKKDDIALIDKNNNDTTTWGRLALRLLQRDMQYWKQDFVQIGDGGAVAAFIAILRGDAVINEAATHAPRKINNEAAVTVVPYHVCIELNGTHTRGMTVVDQRKFWSPPDKPKLSENTQVITSVNAASLKSIFSEYIFDTSK